MAPWFMFFVLSGFCGLLYETVWVRLSMAQFGVTSASLSIVLSLFMGGLALGSWLISRMRARLSRLDGRGAGLAYALTELGIGALALPVPALLRTGGSYLAPALAGQGTVAWYAGALAWQALILLPPCTLMGATLPLGMLAIRKAAAGGGQTSFSYLYLANVLGAALGALLSAFVLIELLGFRQTLLVATAINLGIALTAWARSRSMSGSAEEPPPSARSLPRAGGGALSLLFFTGFCSMGIEVVWMRQFTPFIGTVVYAFALVLALYLLSTFAGSALYRRFQTRAPSPFDPAVLCAVAACGALALLGDDVRHLGLESLWERNGGDVTPFALLRLAIGVVPFSAALGALTPQLVDRYCGGHPERAGMAYAVNTVGCILGPLAAGFGLLPFVSERASLLLFCAPFAIAAALCMRAMRPAQAVGAAAGIAACAVLALGTRSFAESFPQAQLVRDHTATTVATGHGLKKRLLVNGIGMTILAPVTKMMAHLPAALLPHEPRNALVICFGMGTTFRSLRSWGIPVTAVELVPGVPRLFSFFHEDAERILQAPAARIVVDDGRRFLETSSEMFDVIVIDPPPPVSSASSSLLYTREFYALAKRRLAPGGILQQWYPGGDRVTRVAFVRALAESFPHVAAFRAHGMGAHLLASESPIVVPSASSLAARLPPGAAKDLVEWGPRANAEDQLADTLALRLPVEQSLAENQDVAALEDDRPVNEYFLLRMLALR